MRSRLVLLTLAAVWWLPAVPLSAQTDSIGLAINPALTEKVVAPGQLSVVPLTVRNVSQQARAVRIEFRPFAPVDPVVDESARARYDASLWLGAEETELLLAPGESQTVDIRVTPPGDAGPGGHYASVVFRALNQQTTTGNNTSARVNPELAAGLFLTVPGAISELITADYQFPGWLQAAKTRRFTATINNLGNIHVLPTVAVVIRQSNGMEVKRLSFPAKLLIPGTGTVLTAEWPEPPPGIYRAEIQLSYGSPLKSDSRTSSYIGVLPAVWVQLTVIISSAGVLGWVWRQLRRRFRPHVIRTGSYDLAGEPRLKLPAENIERAADSRRIKDSAKKR